MVIIAAFLGVMLTADVFGWEAAPDFAPKPPPPLVFALAFLPLASTTIMLPLYESPHFFLALLASVWSENATTVDASSSVPLNISAMTRASSLSLRKPSSDLSMGIAPASAVLAPSTPKFAPYGISTIMRLCREERVHEEWEFVPYGISKVMRLCSEERVHEGWERVKLRGIWRGEAQTIERVRGCSTIFEFTGWVCR